MDVIFLLDKSHTRLGSGRVHPAHSCSPKIGLIVAREPFPHRHTQTHVFTKTIKPCAQSVANSKQATHLQEEFGGNRTRHDEAEETSMGTAMGKQAAAACAQVCLALTSAGLPAGSSAAHVKLLMAAERS